MYGLMDYEAKMKKLLNDIEFMDLMLIYKIRGLEKKDEYEILIRETTKRFQNIIDLIAKERILNIVHTDFFIQQIEYRNSILRFLFSKTYFQKIDFFNRVIENLEIMIFEKQMIIFQEISMLQKQHLELVENKSFESVLSQAKELVSARENIIKELY